MITESARKAIVNELSGFIWQYFNDHLKAQQVELTSLETDWYNRTIYTLVNKAVIDVAHQPGNELMSTPTLHASPTVKPNIPVEEIFALSSNQYSCQLKRYGIRLPIGNRIQFEHDLYIGCIPELDRMYFRNGRNRYSLLV